MSSFIAPTRISRNVQLTRVSITPRSTGRSISANSTGNLPRCYRHCLDAARIPTYYYTPEQVNRYFAPSRDAQRLTAYFRKDNRCILPTALDKLSFADAKVPTPRPFPRRFFNRPLISHAYIHMHMHTYTHIYIYILHICIYIIYVYIRTYIYIYT